MDFKELWEQREILNKKFHNFIRSSLEEELALFFIKHPEVFCIYWKQAGSLSQTDEMFHAYDLEPPELLLKMDSMPSSKEKRDWIDTNLVIESESDIEDGLYDSYFVQDDLTLEDMELDTGDGLCLDAFKADSRLFPDFQRLNRILYCSIPTLLMQYGPDSMVLISKDSSLVHELNSY